nr:hydroxyethylthiazole kinase [uncultured Rhizobium sp.]
MTLRRVWPHPEVKADLQALRAAQPLTHVLTNIVVANFTANALLALGAAPAMVVAEEEAGEFARVADGLLVNVGTITAADARAQLLAAEAAKAAGTPWALDPVAVGFLSLRTRIATELLAFKPAIIRGNASEILALAGASAGGRGVDSTSGSHEALDGAKDLARRTGAVVAVSGEVDYLTDGDEIVEIDGLEGDIKPREKKIAKITYSDGTVKELPILCRIDTLDEVTYMNNGGILQTVLRDLAA